LGQLARLGFDLQRETQLGALTEDAVKSSEIEGESLNREDVRSSFARRLGIPQPDAKRADRRAEGIAEMLLDATQNFDHPLTTGRLWRWQAALFPEGEARLRRVKTGAWREDAEGPMRVISGPVGRERVHFEAPPASRVADEMRELLDWFNDWFNAPRAQVGLLRAGLVHLWFVTIHPFDDGNGRIARALTDMALSQLEGSGQRFYGLSRQIEKERREYYNSLETTQRGDLDVTGWLDWFVGCHMRAVEDAEVLSEAVLRRAQFWMRLSDEVFTVRQKKVLNRCLDGLEGALTAKKWAAIGNCSPASALRDINDLLERGVLKRLPGGSKNTKYDLAFE
jgi:Fic family protein